MTTDDQNEAKERLLTRIFAPDIYDMLDGEEVGQYVVVTVDLESDSHSYSGPYLSVADAMVGADRIDRDTNKGAGPGEKGWKSHIKPMFPPAEEDG